MPRVPRGVVVGHRSGVSEEHGRLGIGRKGVRFEAKVGDRVYLEDRIAGGTGNRGFRCGVWRRHGYVATKDFAGILKGLTQQVLATPGVRGGGARVVRTQTMPHRTSWGLASARRRSPVWIRARCMSSFWENFARLPCNTMCSHSERHSSGPKRRT